jgi:hypothetical protein
LDRSAAAAAERSLVPGNPSGQPWGPGADRRPGSWAGALAAAPGAPRHPGPGQRPLCPHAGSGPAGGETRSPPPPPSQSPGLRRRPLCRFSGKGGDTGGVTGAPVDAPPAASRAAPPRGDEAPAVKMEVTCLLLLALIPFHCRGQGVYGKSLCPAPRWLSPARKLCKRRKVRAARVWWRPQFGLWSGLPRPRPFQGARRPSWLLRSTGTGRRGCREAGDGRGSHPLSQTRGGSDWNP